ncbi:MAG: ABC transporter permease [Propionibacteriaceae bacterium]|jgi:ABC-type transport system involved in multi-copper enzyme maturation permease subunit|nr:ABC transporter permease [Propionibacteriaceae bacterium]
MSNYSLSLHGLATVFSLEVKQRLRSKRWIVALIAWFLFVGGLTWLGMTIVWMQEQSLGTGYANFTRDAGPTAFSLIMLFVLGMGIVVAPMFTATSINGDRGQNTLAVLQATRLSALEITFGKLLAAIAAATTFLAVALPFIIWTMFIGNVSAWQLLVSFLVLLVEVAVVCAVGLGWSAVFNRTAGSVTFTYLSLLFITVMLPIIMMLCTPFVAQAEKAQYWGMSYEDELAFKDEVYKWETENPWAYENSDFSKAPVVDPSKFGWHSTDVGIDHTERIWWMLAPNPFMVLADATPHAPAYGVDPDYEERDTMSALRSMMYAVKYPYRYDEDHTSDYYNSIGYSVGPDGQGGVVATRDDGSRIIVDTPVTPLWRRANHSGETWPWALGFYALVGIGFLLLATSRLSIPYHRLAKGTRVA